ncbi:hypothetical protein D0861_05444 [Hortaea werneckii]|uniref:SPRY domain-containing protein n=1 Tax=Hortaea werneckii TaxID=91943 RepID=A0A3M7FEJ7_HORWE|nr:hypothetical protein D0861_05444 [Hortaea werneckii]
MCLCIHTPKTRHKPHHFFHWPNFTYAHDHQINPRRIHSTFSLKDPSRPRLARRRNTVQHPPTTPSVPRKAKRSRHSFKTNKSAPATVVPLTASNDMGDQFAPPPGPPPGYRPRQTGSESQATGQHHVQWTGGSGSDPNREPGPNNPYRNAHMNPQAPHQSDAPPAYQPPPGPPPEWQGEKKQSMSDSDFAPPPGPPPGPSQGDGQFAPPPGLPPGRSQGDDQYAPPSGPPPSQRPAEEEPPPYDPWMAVPDSSFLPPPPSMFEERSPTANATYSDAARAHAWCRRNTLWRPQRLPQQTLHRIQTGDIRLTVPPGTNTIHLYQPGPGRTSIRSNSKCPDTILLSDIPIYSPLQSLPQQAPQTVYFELKVSSMGAIDPRSGESDAGIAIGLLAPPYPSWRLPGWHRGSLGVHGDDGRRYVDNSYGGRDFTSAFRKGDVQ